MTGPAAPPGFDRLNGPAVVPVAIALSGGGDSMALLHIAAAWARERRRPLIAFTVDHGLNPASGSWCSFAASAARRLGLPHRVLRWEGPKPACVRPAAARDARHALLAEAARAAGACCLLMAHTADDLAEAEVMRAAGSNAPSPRTWSPSPAWPDGRGVFILRPLLRRRRAALRAELERLGEVWIEDPANDDPRFARTLARRLLQRAAAPPGPPGDLPASEAVGGVGAGPAGDLVVARETLLELGDAEMRRLVAVLSVSAAGALRPPRGAAVGRLVERIRGGQPFIATLAGARIAATLPVVRFSRETGDLLRRSGGPTRLLVGDGVFDGRFEVFAAEPGFRIDCLAGRARRLPPAQRARLSRLPAAVRGGLPAAISPSGNVSCPVFDTRGPVFARPLTQRRAYAALGAFRDEASLCA